MKSATLKPEQIADLVNYVLGLPRRNEHGKVIQEAIPVFVVRVWAWKRERRAVECWCNAALIEAHVIPKRRGKWQVGMPAVLERWREK